VAAARNGETEGTCSSVGTGEKQTEEENDQHGEEERRLLDQEHLVRITEVALTASTNPWRPRVHGVEQWQGSKF
jgi:hypothetical protein